MVDKTMYISENAKQATELVNNSWASGETKYLKLKEKKGSNHRTQRDVTDRWLIGRFWRKKGKLEVNLE